MASSNSLHRTHMKHPSLVEDEVSGARVIYSPLADTFYVLNSSARLIWMLLDRHGDLGPNARAEGKRLYANWFSNPPPSEQIDSDIDAAIALFHEHSLLVEKPNDFEVHYNSSPLHEAGTKREYSPPALKTYDQSWMHENHPTTFYTLSYADVWDPGMPA